MGLAPTAAFQSPSGGGYPFVWLRRRGRRGLLAGHLPLAADGTLLEPRGKLGAELTVEAGAQAARAVALAMLGTLERELGDLDQVAAWMRVLGMVNVAPGFTQVAAVMNGFSRLIIDIFGDEVGAHCRSAVGVAELPFGVAVEIEAEVELAAPLPIQSTS